MHKRLLTAAIMAACTGVSFSTMAASTFSGKTYLDFSNIDQTSNGQTAGKTGTGADIKRLYLSFNHDFDDKWSANATTDFKYDSHAGATQLYIKKAYFQYKFSNAAILRAGSSDLPWVPFAEHLYGYRYVENVLIDRLKFGTSADWGLHLKGKLGGKLFQYAVSVVNGNGYKNPSRSRSMDFEGRISTTPIKNLTLGAGYRRGKLGQDTVAQSANNTASRVNLIAAYHFSMANIGIEYFNAHNYSKTAVKTGPTDKQDGYSVWASVKPMAKMAVFARYDYAKPSKDLHSSLKDQYYNVGVSYKARKNVDMAVVYKHDKVENGTISTSNGSIGGSNEGKYDEIGVWTQVKF